MGGRFFCPQADPIPTNQSLKNARTTRFMLGLHSVADPGCLSRILSFTLPTSRIQNRNKIEGQKNQTFFCIHKFHKIENYFAFEKIWANFQRIIEPFTPKIVKNMSLGSGILEKPIPDPGSRGQKAPDSGSATLGLHCIGKRKKERKNIYFLNHSALVVTQIITIGKNN